jgi:hypothetical protein
MNILDIVYVNTCNLDFLQKKPGKSLVLTWSIRTFNAHFQNRNSVLNCKHRIFSFTCKLHSISLKQCNVLYYSTSGASFKLIAYTTVD